MWHVPDLSRRVCEPELMDDPGLDPAEHERALAGLARLNRTGRAVSILWNAIHPIAPTSGHGPLSVLDIATGSGDIPLGLIRRARRIGLALEVHACDVSEHALGLARDRARRAGATIQTSRLDAVRQEIPGSYDIVMCSLFTHHLREDDVVDLLYRMRTAARRLVLVSDLVRTALAYRLAVFGSRVVSRSRVVRGDTATSMRAAFTIPEVEGIAQRAGLAGARVMPRWPCRFLLAWSRER